MTNFSNFGTPSIYRERLVLETSNSEYTLTTRGTNEKYKIRSSGVKEGSRDIGLLLKCWDPCIIVGTVRARNFKFGKQIDHQGH